MEKPAPVHYNINPLLVRRWSPRAFRNQPIESEKFQRLFEAARWSPSASNEQPWSFLIGINQDNTWKQIFDTLVEFNQLWCSSAPVLGLAIGRQTLAKKEGNNQWFGYDVGQALAHLTFQAMTDELWVHQMGGFDQELAIKLFDIPENYTPLTAFAIGYQGDYKNLHHNLQKSELDLRERKSVQEFVFTEKFGNSLSFEIK